MSGVSVCAFRPSVYLSVKVVETGTIRKLEYGFLFAYGEKNEHMFIRFDRIGLYERDRRTYRHSTTA